MNFFTLLNLRSEWEDIVCNYKFIGSNGTIDNLNKFIETGHKGNRFREGFDRAMEIAQTIVREYNETTNISSLRGEEI